MMLRAFGERRRIVVDGLNRLPGWRCVSPGGAFYAFPISSGTGIDSKTMQNKLLEEAGIATIAGTSFGAHGEGYLRLSYAADKTQIETALERIRGAETLNKVEGGYLLPPPLPIF